MARLRAAAELRPLRTEELVGRHLESFGDADDHLGSDADAIALVEVNVKVYPPEKC